MMAPTVFVKAHAVCTLCNPADVRKHGARDVVRVAPNGEAAFVSDDIHICFRCAQTLFETWKDGKTRYVDSDPTYFGMTGQLAKPRNFGSDT